MKFLFAKHVKPVLLSAVFFLIVQLLHAQDTSAVKKPTFTTAHDTVEKRNGEKIVAKVLEVNQNDIKYKRIDNLDGPLYTLPKEELKFVVYANGIKESYEDYIPPPKINVLPPVDLGISQRGKGYFYKERNISEQDMLAIAEKLGDKNINLAIKKTDNIYFMQKATFVGGLVLFPIGLLTVGANSPRRGRYGAAPTTSNGSRATGQYILLAALACEAVSIGLRFDRRKHAHIVMYLYNKAIENKPKW